MLLVVALSCLAAPSLAAPFSPMGYLEQLQQYRLAYLPQSLNAYINDTLEDGRDVAYDLYDDIKEEVVAKSSVQVDALTKLMERFMVRMMGVRQSVMSVVNSEALSDEEIQARNDKLGLEQLRERFDEMETELVEEAREDEELPEGVEQAVQSYLTGIRKMMAAMANQEAEFWSKLKQMEVQFWQVKNAAADTTNQMRNWIKAAFQTLESIDLNKIGEGVDDAEEELGSEVEMVDEPRAS